jgi:hypothetical protein
VVPRFKKSGPPGTITTLITTKEKLKLKVKQSHYRPGQALMDARI